jgi:hypothetical protein
VRHGCRRYTKRRRYMRQRCRSRCALGHLSGPDRFVGDLISSPETICAVIFWPAWSRFCGGNFEHMLDTCFFFTTFTLLFYWKFSLGALFKTRDWAERASIAQPIPISPFDISGVFAWRCFKCDFRCFYWCFVSIMLDLSPHVVQDKSNYSLRSIISVADVAQLYTFLKWKAEL